MRGLWESVFLMNYLRIVNAFFTYVPFILYNDVHVEHKTGLTNICEKLLKFALSATSNWRFGSLGGVGFFFLELLFLRLTCLYYLAL